MDSSEIYHFKNNFKYSVFERCFINKDYNFIKLNTQEILLIEYLLKNSTEYCSYNELQDVIGKKTAISLDALRTLIKNIRKKTYSNIIINLSGVGYKINYNNFSDMDIMNKKINILVADDQKVNLEFLRFLINKYIDDVNLIFASDGKQAIDILKANEIDIALLDIQMPNIDGWEVAQFIQKRLKDKNIAIIFITSVYLEEEFKNRGFELGAVDYISKPINQNQLINRLKLYVNNFLNEKKILSEMEKHKQKDKLILQQEVSIAQSNILEKIAHHWRQPLSAISSNAGMIDVFLDEQLTNKEQIQKNCRTIVSITNSLSSTVEQFINFYKPENIKTKFNLKLAIDETIKIMNIDFNENNIKLKLKLEDIEFYGFENEIKQILLIVLNNSLDILVEKKSYNFRFLEIRLVQIDEEIEISIIDNGGGIDENMQDKIYHPYFTTKHEYAGVGLSLYLAKELMKRYFNSNLSNQNIAHNFEEKSYKCANFKLNFKKEKG